MRLSIFFLMTLCALLLVACGESRDPNKTYIGVLKLATHPSFDAIEKGMEDELLAQGLKVAFDVQDAKGDMAVATSMAQKFKADNDKLVVGIGAPPVRALLKETADVPIVFSAVSDPQGAGLLADANKGDPRVTGVSDVPVVVEQLKLLTGIDPKIKRIGMIFAGVQGSEGVLTREVRQACKDLGMAFESAPVQESGQVAAAVKALLPVVDAIYVASDSTVVLALETIATQTKAAKKIVVTNDIEASKTTSVLLAWGSSNYKLGRATGRLVAEVLNGKATGILPVRYLAEPRDVDLMVNLDVVQDRGLAMPTMAIKAARYIVKNGVAAEK